MNEKRDKKVYRLANDEAASELRQILSSFKRLHAQKEKIDLSAALKPEVADVPQLQEALNSQRKTHLPNCIVITRLTVL